MSGRRYKPLSPAQARDMIGFGQVSGFAQSPPGNPVFWAKQENGELDLINLKARTADAFTAMINSYAPDDPSVPSAISGLNALDPTTRTFKTYLASSIKYALMNAATWRPTTGPLARMHPSLHVAVGAENAHRTNFSCAEMHAVNNMLWDTNPAGDNAALRIQGTIVTKGTPDALDRGSGGGKATMLPCLSEGAADILGCKAVLTNLGVNFENAV